MNIFKTEAEAITWGKKQKAKFRYLYEMAPNKWIVILIGAEKNG